MSENAPAMPAPPGVTPNFDSPADKLNTVMVVTQILCMVIVTVFFLLRVYVKLSILRTFGKEDYACVVSWVLCMIYCVVAILMTKYGAGNDQYELTIKTMTGFLKTGYAATIVYMPMAFVVKLALLFIIARVFSPFKKAIIFIYVFIGLLAAYYVSGVIVKARPCMPVSAYWSGDLDKCLDQRAIIMADSVASVVSDLIILILPLPLTWSLHMDIKKKLRVMGILAAGGLATAFSIYRLAVVVEQGNTPNQTMFFTIVVLSGNAEIGIGLICACLPALNALLGHRQNSSKQNLSKHTPSGHELSSRVGGGAANGSKSLATRDHEAESDKDYLISNAQGFETSVQGIPASRGDAESQRYNGIVKTVDVSHAYEDTR